MDPPFNIWLLLLALFPLGHQLGELGGGADAGLARDAADVVPGQEGGEVRVLLRCCYQRR